MRVSPILLACLMLGPPEGDPWGLQDGGTRSRLRGLAVAGRDVAWAGGAGGTCLRTIDGGKSWRPVVVPGSGGLDFRDVEAFDSRTASLLSIGPGELSRIYRTGDGGMTWALQHTNPDPKGFLDALAFWDLDHGLALGDPVDGRYRILATDDGGKSWSQVPDVGMPVALPGEGAFAASGTCLVTQGATNAWFGTGGGASARVFRSTDRGRTWAAAGTPIRAGNPSSGIFSIAFRDADHGIAVGGDYALPDDPTGNLASTVDGGRTWVPGGDRRPAGFRSAVAFVPGRPGPTIVTVGPSGADLSADGGRTWSTLGRLGFHALGFGASADDGWAVGDAGRIGKLALPDF